MGASEDIGGADGQPQRILRVLLDTNVVLDLMLRRAPWADQAQPLVDAREAGQLIGYLPASVLTDIFYISRRLIGVDRAFEVVDRCLEDFELLPVDRAIIETARRLPGNDFEDNAQIAGALAAGLDLIVTRDIGGFAHSPIPAVAPLDAPEYLAAS